MYHVCTWCPQRLELEGGSIGSPRTGGAGDCEPPSECWELILGPLQKQLFSNTEPSL